MSILEAAVAYRLLTSRATLTGPDGLEGIDTSPINQGALVLAAGAVYRLDRGSSTAPDGLTVLAPVLGPGRWLFVAGSGGAAAATAADLTALAALGAFSPDLVWVETLLCYWHRNATSTLTPDGITVVAAVGGGNWERIVPTTSPDWLAQAAWTIDPLLGDDENAGGALAPLASFDELNRRLSVGALRQNTTATIVADASLPSIDLSVDSGVFSFLIEGTPTVVYTDTVATYTERVHATPVASQLTATGVVDWTPYVGMRLRITSGAAAGAIAWIERANPGGAGLNVARTSRVAGAPSNFGISTIFVPAPGSEFVIENLPTSVGISVDIRGTESVTIVPGLKIDSISIQGTTSSLLEIISDKVLTTIIDGCSLDSSLSLPDNLTNTRTSVTRCKTGGTITDGVAIAQGSFNIKYGLQAKRLMKVDAAVTAITSQLIAGASDGIFLGGGGGMSQLSQSMVLTDVQIFDCSVSGINQERGTSLVVSRAGLSGNGNSIGILIGGTAASSRGLGITFGWPSTADLPNLLGTTTPIRIEGSTDTDLTWAQVPFDSGAQRGVGTLVDGTATITARDANTRGVTVSHATLAGTAVGALTVPTGTRTASQFVVNSVDAAGALVDDDSTFDWQIPPMARKVVIAQLDSASAAA